jgi:hypothetical protein
VCEYALFVVELNKEERNEKGESKKERREDQRGKERW